MSRYWTRRRAIVPTMMVAAAVAALALAGCNSASATTSTPPSAAAVESALSGSQTTGTGGNSAGKSAGATQRNSAGNVTIDVTWENPKETSGPLTFSVAMNTHSVDLDGVDLGRLAVLRNDSGQEVKPQKWDAPSGGGHHRSGVLTFPSKDSSGKPIVGPGTKTLELVIRDVAGVKERVLRWEIS